jgi:hypothetical protein
VVRGEKEKLKKMFRKEPLRLAPETGRYGMGWGVKPDLVPGRGLEPPRCYPLAPEASASTNSATRAGCEGAAMYARGPGLSIE